MDGQGGVWVWVWVEGQQGHIVVHCCVFMRNCCSVAAQHKACVTTLGMQPSGAGLLASGNTVALITGPHAQHPWTESLPGRPLPAPDSHKKSADTSLHAASISLVMSGQDYSPVPAACWLPPHWPAGTSAAQQQQLPCQQHQPRPQTRWPVLLPAALTGH